MLRLAAAVAGRRAVAATGSAARGAACLTAASPSTSAPGGAPAFSAATAAVGASCPAGAGCPGIPGRPRPPAPTTGAGAVAARHTHHGRGLVLGTGLFARTAPAFTPATMPPSPSQRRTKMWSVEREPGHTYKAVDDIIPHVKIMAALESTRAAARDPATVASILEAARQRALLTSPDTPEPGPSEYVQGLSLEECATLLNLDAYDEAAMAPVYSTALAIKERIYGNRVVLFAPLYLSNYCVNTCRYCAFACTNKTIERTALTDDQVRAEVEALERQGHRRLLVLTGEHPRYDFDTFLHALGVIADVKTEPCGNIRRMNVEIPSLSVSDMRRLKATNHVGTYTLFQETYDREVFKYMHPSGPKSGYDHRILTMDRAMLAGLDDVGIGALFGLADYRYEVLGMLCHAQHLDETYGAGPHTISVPRMRHADSSDVADAPPHPVDDANFKKLVAILRIAVPYTGMILSTRESPEMRRELLRVGMSQMSAGSRTNVGAYHKDRGCPDTDEALGKDLAGQFSLMDHRPVREIVSELMKDGYVPSWCTACYRKGRTGPAFMKIARAGAIHDFCHPNSLLTLREYLQDYGTPEEVALGEAVIAREGADEALSPGARRLLQRKLAKVKAGEHDVYV